MTDQPTQSQLWYALTEYLRVLPEERRLEAHAAAVQAVAEYVRAQGSDIEGPPSEHAREVVARIRYDMTIDAIESADRGALLDQQDVEPELHEHESRCDAEQALISRPPAGGYYMTGAGVLAAWIVGRLAMGVEPEELQRQHPGLSDCQIELAQILRLSYAIGEARDGPDAETDLLRIHERLDELRAERDARRAIDAEIAQAPERYRLDVLRMLAGTARRERRLFEMIDVWDDEEGPPPESEARDRLRTRFDWQIKREDLDRAGADAHTDAGQTGLEDSGEGQRDERDR